MKQLATNYSFNADAKTVTLTGLNVPLNYVLLIVNATRNQIIYNLADPATGAQSYAQGANSVITLKANLDGMANSDQLTIFYDNGSPSETILVQGPIGPQGEPGPQGPPGAGGGGQSLYDTSISDTVTSVAVGGSPAGTTAQTWKTRTIVEVLDSILFPDVLPTYTPATLTLTLNQSGTFEVGQSLSVAATLTGTKNDAGPFGGERNFNRLRNNVSDLSSTSGWDSNGVVSGLDLPSQFSHPNPNNPNQRAVAVWTHPITLSVGTYVWTGSAAQGHAAGQPKKNNKGVLDTRPAGSGINAPQAAVTSLTSPNQPSISAIFPWFWGTVVGGDKPTTADIASIIAAGGSGSNRLLTNSDGQLSIPFTPYDETFRWFWFAHPVQQVNNVPVKTRWYVNTSSLGLISNTGQNLFNAPTDQAVDAPLVSPETSSRWTNRLYKVYISNYQTRVGEPMLVSVT